MPGYPVPFIKFREDDANGHPLAGGQLYSFAAGTSTPLATYTTHALNVPNENPTILDASGRASIYIQDGVGYKFALYDALGNLVWLEDNVEVPEVLAPAPPAEVPIGGIVMFAGMTLPSGWLLCDGSSKASATYPALYAVILNHFGGNATNFLLPDLRQRFPLGVAVSGVGSTLGDKAGAIDHSHTGPSHAHTIPAHTHNIAGHTHSVPYNSWSTTPGAVGPQAGTLQAGATVGNSLETSVTYANANNTTGASSAAETSSQALTTDAGGTQATGTANPPLLALHFIIRYA